MKRVKVEIPDFIGGKLIKDLRENEAICKSCKGVGLEIKNNDYGIEGERKEELFPYKHQSIGFCPNCYNGVVKTCTFCGKHLDRKNIECDCEEHKKHKHEQERKKNKETFEKARKMTWEEYEKEFPGHMMFEMNSGEFYSDLDEISDAKEEGKFEGSEIQVYGTYRVSVSLDLDYILEYGCSDLHEDALDKIKGYEELSEAIRKFNSENEKITSTYYPEYAIAIVDEKLEG